MAAETTPVARDINGFILSTISPITKRGTKNSHPVVLNVAFMVCKRLLISASPEVSIVMLKIENTIRVIIIVGTVV